MNIKIENKQQKEDIVLRSQNFPKLKRKRHTGFIKSTAKKLLDGWVEMMKDGIPT